MKKTNLVLELENKLLRMQLAKQIQLNKKLLLTVEIHEDLAREQQIPQVTSSMGYSLHSGTRTIA